MLIILSLTSHNFVPISKWMMDFEGSWQVPISHTHGNCQMSFASKQQVLGYDASSTQIPKTHSAFMGCDALWFSDLPLLR